MNREKQKNKGRKGRRGKVGRGGGKQGEKNRQRHFPLEEKTMKSLIY